MILNFKKCNDILIFFSVIFMAKILFKKNCIFIIQRQRNLETVIIFANFHELVSFLNKKVYI